MGGGLAKNVTDPEVRAKKWDKARPIAPTFTHPMRALMHLVATLIATLKKVEFMAGDEVQRGKSAVLKLKEFQELGYPRQVRQSGLSRGHGPQVSV